MAHKEYPDLFLPVTAEEKECVRQGCVPYRSPARIFAHAASLLPLPKKTGVRVEIEVGRFMDISKREIRRIFPRQAVVNDVYNLVVSEGFEPGIFELDVRAEEDQEDLRGCSPPDLFFFKDPEKPRGRRVTDRRQQKILEFGETVRFYVAHSNFYLTKRLYG